MLTAAGLRGARLHLARVLIAVLLIITAYTRPWQQSA
jgi:hypothetical protein